MGKYSHWLWIIAYELLLLSYIALQLYIFAFKINNGKQGHARFLISALNGSMLPWNWIADFQWKACNYILCHTYCTWSYKYCTIKLSKLEFESPLPWYSEFLQNWVTFCSENVGVNYSPRNIIFGHFQRIAFLIIHMRFWISVNLYFIKR